MKNSIMQNETASRPRWMIVDDNQDTLSLIHDIVARFDDVDIECFHSPQDALTAFEAEPGAFEFVITDLDISHPDDAELCRRLRAFSPSLKILLSAGNEIMSDEEAAQKGFCDLPRKPLPLAALQPALEPATLKFSGNFLVLTAA
jgi:two-component system, cell cycle sensor histidine kinase and response regulator CckA